MALKIWLPLNKDLKNQGTEVLENPSKNTTAFVSGGKLGNSYMTGSYGFHMDREILGNSWTIAVWIKATEAFPTNRSSTIFCKNISTAYDDLQLILSIFLGKTLNIGFNGNWNRFQIPYTFVVNTWYHIAASYDGNIAKLYVNGELLGSKEVTTPQVTGATNIMINGRSTNSNGTLAEYLFPGCFNDVRLYDEALSPLQIKEISKGLMCHLKLDNNGNGLPNLGDFETIAKNWYIDSTSTNYISKADYYDSTFGNTIKITVGNSDTVNKRIYKHTYDVWFKDQIYTVSFWAKAETNGVICNMSRSTIAGNYTGRFALTTEWKKYIGTITSTATAPDGTLSFTVVTNDCIVYITQIKLENGDKATAYQPGVEDPHYNLLGYNSNEVIDCSGFGNNFTKVNDVSYDTNSARNTVCTNFTDQSYLVSNQDSDKFLPTEAITVNLWIKFSTFDSPISCTQAGGWSFYPLDGKIRWHVRKNGAYNYYTSITTIESLQDNKWHMLTGIYDSPNQRLGIYIDGVKEKDEIIYKGGLIEYATNRLIVAGEALDGAIPEHTLYVGGISDVRIYATALSEDDIADLYKAAAKIDNKNNFLTGEFIEEGVNSIITKNSLVKASQIYDDAFINKKTIIGKNINPNLIQGECLIVKDKNGVIISKNTMTAIPSATITSLIGQKIFFSYEVACEGDRYSTEIGQTAYNYVRFGTHLGLTVTNEDGTTQILYPCSSAVTYSGEKKRYIEGYIIPNGYKTYSALKFHVQAFDKPASTNNNIWYMTNFKIEVGDYATPYIPSSYNNDSWISGKELIEF